MREIKNNSSGNLICGAGQIIHSCSVKGDLLFKGTDRKRICLKIVARWGGDIATCSGQLMPLHGREAMNVREEPAPEEEAPVDDRYPDDVVRGHRYPPQGDPMREIATAWDDDLCDGAGGD